MKALFRGAAAAAALGLLAIVLGVAWFWYAIYRDRSHPPADAQVVIERGSSFSEVARRLGENGVIGNVAAFRLLAHLRGDERNVRAGEYRFAAHQTQNEVLRALVSGGAQVAAWVTIPEGFTAAQIARRLERDGIGSSGDFERSFKAQSIVVGGKRTEGLEGFLFPDTYLIPLGASARDVEGLLTGEFFRQLPSEASERARGLGVTVPQAVTVASLIEREAKVDADRPMIAAVIYNRLRLGMPLQIDATIEYALPRHKSELSFDDLKVDSPYNTYTHRGLPPTPIANPGRASLEAALHPSKSDDLYYVYCGHGHHVFAKTLAQHQADVARCLQ